MTNILGKGKKKGIGRKREGICLTCVTLNPLKVEEEGWLAARVCLLRTPQKFLGDWKAVKYRFCFGEPTNRPIADHISFAMPILRSKIIEQMYFHFFFALSYVNLNHLGV